MVNNLVFRWPQPLFLVVLGPLQQITQGFGHCAPRSELRGEPRVDLRWQGVWLGFCKVSQKRHS